MGIKKKIGLGVASAALGISLVGGGTWAAFNDVETLSASYAAGKLDLTAADTTSTGINLSNLKPGDVFQKEFELDNVGTLAIKDVLLKLTHSNFVDYVGGDDTDIWGKNSAADFLRQFTITVISSGTEGGNGYSKDIVKDVNLFDFIEMTAGKGVPPNAGSVDSNYYDAESGRINVITKTGADQSYHGLPVNPDDKDKVLFTIKFEDIDDKDNKGRQIQNKYQGDSITLDFNFEARQWGGLTIEESHVDEDGYISENEKSHSEDGAAVNPGDDEEPGDGGGDPTPEVTLTGVEVDDDWSTYTEWFQKKYKVTATATFTFSDGTVLSDTKSKNSNANKHGETFTFSVNHPVTGEVITETRTVKWPDGGE
ncbi:major biofilm matrix component TasA [Cytobacillus firmus DS1]|uniref:Major biofilm matrix component TasA n=1 Tax=Cytobacillus firmus DS1 TaxID=1307436 RepID=W7LD71_CYTFI|nr:major biofilm matrix component TasA [Cytobacillus firmus DS1]